MACEIGLAVARARRGRSQVRRPIRQSGNSGGRLLDPLRLERGADEQDESARSEFRIRIKTPY